MKRFWLFTYSEYYPEGGGNDLEKSFENFNDLEKYLLSKCNYFFHIRMSISGWHVFDAKNEKILFEKYNSCFTIYHDKCLHIADYLINDTEQNYCFKIETEVNSL